MPVHVPYTLAPGATAPTRATPGAAGLDLHAYLLDGPRILSPGERARIRTGVSLALPTGHEGQVRPRSGLALNHGLTVLNSPGTIDADYRGEIAVLLVNHGGADAVIRDGDRIAQLVIAPVADAALVEADALPPTERGAGGFGSTGTGPADDDRALLEARVRALEAEVCEARAEAAQWAAELDAERANAAARERVYARTHDALRAAERDIDGLRSALGLVSR